MGFLSSWAAMAFSHHVLVRWAAVCVGKPEFTDYSILGDDIVIWDSKVANEYKILLSELGVEISIQKSFSEIGLAEFAKTYYCKGVEHKPIPGQSLVFRRGSTPLLMMEVMN